MAATTGPQLEVTRVSDTPKGNWAARNLRLLNADTKELFPKTPAENKPGKFHSIYKKDFYEYPTEVVLEGLAPKGQAPERETIRDVLFGQSPTAAASSPRRHPKHPVPPAKACLLPPNPDDQGFAAWRIPNRLSGEVEDAKIGDHIGVAVPEKVVTPRILRQSTLPAIPARSSRGKVVGGFTPKPRLTAADAVRLSEAQTTGPLKRAKTTLDVPSLPLDTGLSRFQSRAAQWQEKLPDVDPRLLHRVLRLQELQPPAADSSQSPKLRGTLLPDARRTVERWLESASENERQVALQFFRSLAGGSLMGVSQGVGNTARLKDVLDALQNPGSRWVAEAGLSPRAGLFGPKHKTAGGAIEEEEGEATGRGGAGPKHLKHLRLLGSNVRHNRWMHTTWHHLPQYQQTPDASVNNSGSHYVQPHQFPHRHFVIHPEWPPQQK